MDNGDFVVQNNPNLTCIQVDDATYSTNTWTRIDRQMSFNQDCPSLSIEDDLLISDILIYPNPTSNILNLKIEKSYKLFKEDAFINLSEDTKIINYWQWFLIASILFLIIEILLLKFLPS